jgi:protein involved in polysaccharide export with SLBB domain
VTDDKRKLVVGDQVSFTILEDRIFETEPKEPRRLIVTDSGELDIPYIGRLNAAGKTCRQVAEEAKALLERDYYYKATVIVGLDQTSRILGRVYVWGPVRNQGAIEIPANEEFTAGKAILRAGGFGDFANRKAVKVIRKTDTGTETTELNMVDILERGRVDLDVVLKPDDFVIVPQRAFNF